MRIRTEAPKPARGHPGLAHDYIGTIEHELIAKYLYYAALLAMVLILWGGVILIAATLIGGAP